MAVWIRDPFMRIQKKAGGPTMKIESTHQAMDIHEEDEKEIENTVVTRQSSRGRSPIPRNYNTVSYWHKRKQTCRFPTRIQIEEGVAPSQIRLQEKENYS